jgi:RNA polymerase-binding transcription factor DksA
MNQAEFDFYRGKLERLANRLRTDTLAVLKQTQRPAGRGDQELSNAPMHLGDMGTEEYLYDLNTVLLENEQHIESAARAALRRLDDGTYGQCEACGKAIARARLNAIPYTRYCVQCADSNDETPQVNLNQGRPRQPSDTLAPEGEMQENRLRPVDAWDPQPPQIPRGDVHAAGTAGGGTAVGGLAGTNEGHGDPIIAELQQAAGSSEFDCDDARSDPDTPRGGPSGGAVGGTPAFKRTR